MRSRSPCSSSLSSSSSSRHGQPRTAAVERLTNYAKDKDARVSSAHNIRCLVKQLCSSSMATKGSDEAAVDSDELPPDDAHLLHPHRRRRRRRCQEHTAAADRPPARKQTRRRVHTSRPYQERLINMAEARREIVAALKLHRAAMKLRAREQEEVDEEEKERHNKQKKSPQPPRPVVVALEEPPDLQLAPSISSTTSPALTPPFVPQLQVHQEVISLSLPAWSYFDDKFLDPYIASSVLSSLRPHPWENPDHLTFPSGPLGLNLNLQNFNNMDHVSLYRHGINSGNIVPPTSMQLPSTPPSLLLSPSASSPFYSSSSSSSSHHYSFACPDPTSNNYNNIGDMPGLAGVPAAPEDDASPDPQASEVSPARQLLLHPMVGVEEMAEIRSVGDRHDMEWNDRVNVATSAWWCNLLGTMEASPHRAQQRADVGDTNINVGSGEREELVGTKDDLGFFFDDVVMDIPAWLNNEEQQPNNHYSSEKHPKDTPSVSLPW